MAAERSPGFFFDVQKWRSSRSVQRMSFAERGVYLEMLLEQWEKRNLPDDSQAVAVLLSNTAAHVAEVLAAWEAVRPTFVTSPSDQKRIYNASLERTRRKQSAFRRNRREAGERGGKAAAAKRRQQRELEASLATASFSSAVANSSDQNREDQRREDQKEEQIHVRGQVHSFLKPDSAPIDTPLVKRAALFVDRYQALYRQHRHGARYAFKGDKDQQAAVTLCQTWPDERLEKLAIVFLKTDHQFAASGSRTLPQFLALASWCDGQLAEYEAKHGALA